MITNRDALSYGLLSYLDAPITVMGVQQAPGLNNLQPKNYSYEWSHFSGLTKVLDLHLVHASSGPWGTHQSRSKRSLAFTPFQTRNKAWQNLFFEYLSLSSRKNILFLLFDNYSPCYHSVTMQQPYVNCNFCWIGTYWFLVCFQQDSTWILFNQWRITSPNFTTKFLNLFTQLRHQQALTNITA